MAGELEINKNFNSTALTFWLVFVIGMVLVMTLYRGFTAPDTPLGPEKACTRKIQKKSRTVKGHTRGSVGFRQGRPLKPGNKETMIFCTLP